MATNPVEPPPTVVVISAYNEQERISATVVAAREIPSVASVIVVDDGSADDTASAAQRAGATVIRCAQNAGKAAAMERGASQARTVVSVERWNLLFLDADLGDTAVGASTLLPPLWRDIADMTIATLPSAANAGGGRGFVVRLARDGIAQATGWQPTQPLSGQRAITSAAFAAALPLARGFGVEVGLTIDLLRKGYRVQEVPADLLHRVTGTDWRAQRHRARQFWAVWRALRSRGVGPVLPLPR